VKPSHLTASAVLAAGILLGGCSASQARGGALDGPERGTVEFYTQRHGSSGYEIATIFNSPTYRDALRAEPGSELVVVEEFYTVRVARDLTRRDVLTEAGYCRRRKDLQSSGVFYEFFDTRWVLIGMLESGGVLKLVDNSGRASVHGKSQLDEALIVVYGARNGGSYDFSGADTNRAKMAFVSGNIGDKNGDEEAAEVRLRSPRDRGVVLRTARDNAPVIELRRYRPMELRGLSDTLQRDRFDASKEEELRRLREQRRGTEAGDGAYGGMEFKDGQPVDSEGRPLKRGDASK